MTASSAVTAPVGDATRASVLLAGAGWESGHDVTELLSNGEMLVTDETTEPLDSLGHDLLDAHDVVVLACGDGDFADDVRQIGVRCPGARIVVVLDATGRRSAIRRALDAGAVGVVWSSTLASVLAPTVGAVAAGQVAVPLVHRDEVVRATLTTREKQILGLVVMGLSNGEIADKLYLAESTVKSHLSSAFGKLGVRSRNEATALILDPDSGVGPGILGIPSGRLGPAG